MRVGLNIGQQNSFMNVARVNQGIRSNSPAMQNTLHSSRRDRSDISPAGKAGSLIEQLMQRKREITDSKSALVESTLKNGNSMDSIKTQLETYEEQLKAVDEQIATLMAPEPEKAKEKTKDPASEPPKTEQEIQSERINSLTDIASDIELTKRIASSKEGLDRTVRVLKSEIRQDRLHSPATGSWAKAASTKQAQVDKLEQRSNELASDIGSQLAEANSDMAQTAKPRPTIDETIEEKLARERGEDTAEETAEDTAEDTVLS